MKCTDFKGGITMLSEEEKKAIELLECIKNNSWTTKYIMSSDSKNADILLHLITKLQKENKEKDRYIKNKDKQIDLMAELVYKRFKAELLLEYGFENEEQLKQYFADLVEKE